MKTYKKNFCIILSLILLVGLSACEDKTTNPTPLTKYWKLKVKEIWWVSPNDASGDYVNIDNLPVGVNFPDAKGTKHIYTGSEYKITRTDTPTSGLKDSIYCTWSEFPEKIEAGKMYSLFYQSKGNALNGISISFPTRYDTRPTAWSPASMRDGEKSISFKIAEPTDSIPSHMKIVVTMTSGIYYNLDYWYVYEWIKE
jgi:hypothetical protein